MLKPLKKLGSGYALEFSPDGRYLVTMPSSSSAKLFRVGDFERIATLDGLKVPRFAAFVENSQVAVIASMRQMIATFEIPSGRLIRKWRIPHHADEGSVVVTPDRKHIIVPGDECSLLIYSLDTGKLVDQFQLEDEWGLGIAEVQFTRNGKYLGVLWWRTEAEERTILTVFSWPTKKVVREVSLDVGAQACPIRVGKDATCFYASFGRTGVLSVDGIGKLPATRGDFERLPLGPLKLPKSMSHFGYRFSDCGSRLLIWNDEFLRVCHGSGAFQCAQLALLEQEDDVYDAAFSPDLEFLAVATSHVHIWRTRDLLSSTMK